MADDVLPPAPLDYRTPFFDVTAEEWPDRHAAAGYVRKMHELDLARAEQPPEVHVTLTGVPGHFVQVPGTGVTAYHVSP